jgi:hypothetical protein
VYSLLLNYNPCNPGSVVIPLSFDAAGGGGLTGYVDGVFVSVIPEAGSPSNFKITVGSALLSSILCS